MATFIGFLELGAWILAVTALAAGVTYAVVKLFPGREEQPKAEETSPAS